MATPRQQRIAEHFGNKYETDSGSTHTNLTCRRCNNDVRWSNQTINKHLREGTTPPCKSDFCAPKIPNGFAHYGFVDNDIPIISCRECYETYYNHKKSNYFVCYCKLKIKGAEHNLYHKLVNAGHRVYREAYFDKNLSSHKCDLLVFHDDRKIYLEVDGREHYGSEKDQEFQALFREWRTNDDFLVRIRNNCPEETLQNFLDKLEEVDLADISLLTGTRDGNPVFRVL